MNPPTPRFWVASVNLDQVAVAAAGGFTQAGHGGDTRLRRLARGDQIAFYSPRSGPGSARPLQQLTALGEVADDEPLRAAGLPDPAPWRRGVDYEDVRAVPIRPLLPLLGFITDEQKWGLPFRSGLLEVTAGDFGVIAGALRDALDVPLEYSASGRSARA